MPSSSGCWRRSFSVFQPMCGIFRLGSSGVMRSTSPGIQPRPSTTSYSRPRSAISCMPTQMPRNGRPFWRTVSFSASTMPGTASSPRRQSAKAPTPGSTTRSARAHLLGIVGHQDRLIVRRTRAPRARTPSRPSADCPSRSRRSRPSWPRLRLREQPDDVGWRAAAANGDGSAGGGAAPAPAARRARPSRRRSAARPSSQIVADHHADAARSRAARASSAAGSTPRCRPAATAAADPKPGALGDAEPRAART